MLDYIKQGVKDYNDDEEISQFLRKLLSKEAGDRSGLIYGIGHAAYTKSDPRAGILQSQARELANETGYSDDLKLLEAVERLAPCVLTDNGKKQAGSVCANIDLYSGLVYRMLHIPAELYTPLFAVARMAGLCSHRIEKMVTCNRIIRPAYKTLGGLREYIPLSEREALQL